MLEVAIKSKSLFKDVFMAYVVPFIGPIVGYFTRWATAYLLDLSHFASFSGGIFMAVGIMGSFLPIRKRAKTYNPGYEIVHIFHPTITSRLSSCLPEGDA